jgi:hypothetical protein
MISYMLPLTHGAIAALLLAGWWLPARVKSGVAMGASVVGMIAGGITFALHNSNETWRAVTYDGPGTAVASAAAVCAWLVVGVLDLGERRYSSAAFTGVAASGLVLFASSGWSVPALLFWTVASIAALGLIVRTGDGERALHVAILLVSDALLAGALMWHALDHDSWALPAPARGGAFWLALVAALIRAGVVPRAGPWGLLGTSSASVLPLLAGGGAVIAGKVAGGPEPWLAVALLLLATWISIRGVLSREVRLGVLAVWPAALGMAAIYVGADAVGVGGLALVVAATVHALWHERPAVVSVESAAAIAIVPTTVGFAAVAVTASAAFFRTDLAESAGAKAPWVAVASVLPVALCASLTCAARIARDARARAETRGIMAWAVRVLLVASLVAGGAATTTGELGAPAPSELWLLVAAALVATVAGVTSSIYKREPVVEGAGSGAVTASGGAEGGDAIEIAVDRFHPSGPLARAVTPLTILVALCSLGAIAYFTFEGLRQGFL